METDRERRKGRQMGARRTTGIGGGLESALRGMDQANMDLGIFQETK